MQQVGEDVRGKLAVAVEKLVVDVEEVTILSSATFAMRALAAMLILRRPSLLSFPRGKMASTSTFVFGTMLRNSATIACTPAAMSAGESPLEALLVPIITTASLGEMPSRLPWPKRQSTHCV